MSDELPEVIQRYLEVAPKGDAGAIVACFAEDAEVTDEGETHVGRAAIRAWREAVASAFVYTTTVASAEPTGPSSYLVTAKVEGNFPGSPVELRFDFTVTDGLISKLIIAP